MKRFKQLTLVLASLLVVAFSFNFTKLSGSTSLQSKTIDCQFAVLAVDDIDDDFADPEFQNFVAPSSIRYSPRQIEANVKAFEGFCLTNSPVPFYLQIRNLRI